MLNFDQCQEFFKQGLIKFKITEMIDGSEKNDVITFYDKDFDIFKKDFITGICFKNFKGQYELAKTTGCTVWKWLKNLKIDRTQQNPVILETINRKKIIFSYSFNRRLEMKKRM